MANSTTFDELERVIERIFETILNSFRNICRPTDKVKFMIDQDYLDSPILIFLCRFSHLTNDRLLHQILSVLQLKRKVSVDRSFNISVSVMREVNGGVSKVGLLLSERVEDLHRKRSVIRIRNGDGDRRCLARAILVAWVSRVRVENAEFNSMKQPDELSTDAMFRMKKCSHSLFRSMVDVSRPHVQGRAV